MYIAAMSPQARQVFVDLHRFLLIINPMVSRAAKKVLALAHWERMQKLAEASLL